MLRLFIRIMAKLKQSSNEPDPVRAITDTARENHISRNIPERLFETAPMHQLGMNTRKEAPNETDNGLRTIESIGLIRDDVLDSRAISASDRPFSALDYGSVPGVFAPNLDLDFGIIEHENFLQWLDQPQMLDSYQYQWQT